MKPPVVTVDGPAGSGKTTLGRRLALALRLPFVDTGLFYRGVTLAAVRAGLAPGDDLQILELARRTRIEVNTVASDQSWEVQVDGVDPGKAIRDPRNAPLLTAISQMAEVRRHLLSLQRLPAAGGAVAVGRDCGTVVFPEARVKLYLQANPSLRTARRAAQLQAQGSAVDEETLESEIAGRDLGDQPAMRPAANAIVIDTGRHSIDEMVQIALAHCAKAGLLPLDGSGDPPAPPSRSSSAGYRPAPSERPHSAPSGPDLNYRWMTALMRFLSRLVVGDLLDVSGTENVPRAGGLLVVSNHVGTVDPPFMGAHVPRRDLYFMTKSEYFRSPLARFFIVGYHGFPVVRGTADRAALRQALGLLAQGHAVVVYPEGHRSPDGRLQRPHPGAGFLARAAGVPILPVAIWGTERALPIGSWRPRRAPIHLRFGMPAPLPPAGTDARRASNQEIADLLMLRIADVLPEHRRGIFDGSTEYRAVPPPAA